MVGLMWSHRIPVGWTKTHAPRSASAAEGGITWELDLVPVVLRETHEPATTVPGILLRPVLRRVLPLEELRRDAQRWLDREARGEPAEPLMELGDRVAFAVPPPRPAAVARHRTEQTARRHHDDLAVAERPRRVFERLWAEARWVFTRPEFHLSKREALPISDMTPTDAAWCYGLLTATGGKSHPGGSRRRSAWSVPPVWVDLLLQQEDWGGVKLHNQRAYVLRLMAQNLPLRNAEMRRLGTDAGPIFNQFRDSRRRGLPKGMESQARKKLSDDLVGWKKRLQTLHPVLLLDDSQQLPIHAESEPGETDRWMVWWLRREPSLRLLSVAAGLDRLRQHELPLAGRSRSGIGDLGALRALPFFRFRSPTPAGSPATVFARDEQAAQEALRVRGYELEAEFTSRIGPGRMPEWLPEEE